jgi:hypothetical protein
LHSSHSQTGQTGQGNQRLYDQKNAQRSLKMRFENAV